MEQGFLNRPFKPLKKDADVSNIEGCVDAAVRTDDGGVKGLKSPLTTKDNDHAAVGTKIIPTAACIDKKDTTCGSNNTPFADLLKDENLQQTVHLTKQNNEVDIVGADVAIPQADVDMIKNYVKHVWAKYGLERVMLHQGFFLFKFSSKEGMDSVMKNGPWRIRLVPILLSVWNAEEQVKKEDIKRIPVWVKLFNVPIVAYSEIGLSLITSKLGRLIMLDAHTSSMCLNSWGLSSYARALVEITADLDLVESLVVVIPRRKGKEHLMENTTQQKANTLPNSKDDVNGACDKPYLRSNLDKIMEEEKVLDINTDFGMDNVVELKDKTNVDSTGIKSMIKDGTVQEKGKEDEVYMPDDVNSKYISSTGEGFTMEEDDLDCYDGYEAHIYDLPKQMQAFCDHCDIHLKSHARKLLLSVILM
ncbi:zinc knuckle CX2CX4HX4C containing protein [Tanacetum coccineum]